MLAVLNQARRNSNAIAILDGSQSYSYEDLLQKSAEIGTALLDGHLDLAEARVAFMVPPGFEYVATLWGIWQAGGVAVPLCLTHPLASLSYTLSDSGSYLVVASREYEPVLKSVCAERKLRLVALNDLPTRHNTSMPAIPVERRALILYTSGTTSLPKGVVTTHRNLEAQICTLISAWHWSASDHVLCVLPLHHVHGIVNVVCCALWAGACCEFTPAFDAGKVLEVFAQEKVNVFMAVPTIYFKLIATYETLSHDDRERISRALNRFRLMVSGSAALPVLVMENWKRISGHLLLERYGMTELGMAIANPYAGERRAGHVGIPLPGVSIRICNERDEVVVDEPGEIQVKGENVFLEYWNKPEVTRQSFTADGWFKTGDVAIVEQGYYRILGRSSVDIIKSGGYKISALEIEEILRQYPGIKDCAVVGLENEEWGEIVAAALVPHEAVAVDIHVLSTWLREQLPPYRIPRMFQVVSELPRNSMGKVTKNDVKKLFQSEN